MVGRGTGDKLRFESASFRGRLALRLFDRPRVGAQVV